MYLIIDASAVLLVEDDPNDILLTQRAFRKANLAHASLQIVSDGDSAVFYLSGEGKYSDRDRYPLKSANLIRFEITQAIGS